MRILLVQPSPYFWLGGAHKANRILMEGLAARGHCCRALVLGVDPENHTKFAAFMRDIEARGAQVIGSTSSGVALRFNGVEVYTAKDRIHLGAELVTHVREFEPTWTLITEDTKFFLVEAALEVNPTNVVYIAHTPANLSFGPDSQAADPARDHVLRRVAGIITVSRYMREYIKQWGGMAAETIYFPVYGDPPFVNFGKFASGYVTMINPSDIKGLAIFLGLARALPEVEFAAVPTWASSDAAMIELQQLRNVRVLRPVDEMDEIWAQTRVLVVPSLWGEAFGQVVVEAMLRGLPVIASDSGGLVEAKLGEAYTVAVRKIERYEGGVAVVPEQELGPWVKALGELLGEAERYEEVSRRGREAALRFNEGLGIGAFEKYLKELSERREERREAKRGAGEEVSAGEVKEKMESLTAERRALLALMLKKKHERAIN